GGIWATALGSLLAKICRRRSPAVLVWLAIANTISASAVAPPQPQSQRNALRSRRRLRESRKPGCGGACSIAMVTSIGESLKTLAECGKSRLYRTARAVFDRASFAAALSRILGCGQARQQREPATDAPTNMPCHCPCGWGRHAYAPGNAEGCALTRRALAPFACGKGSTRGPHPRAGDRGLSATWRR